MVASMRVDGADISHYQNGKLDLAIAKRAGIKFLYHKATEGERYTDPNYNKRRAEAAAAGIPFGGYHFARPGAKDAIKEAQHFLAVAKPKPGDLRPALDLETTEGRTLAQLREWARQWCSEVEKATGVKPIVYTPFDLGEAVKGSLLWRPRYNNQNRPPSLAWDIWQFSNGRLGKPNKVAGLGRVDINTLRKGLKVSDLLIPKVATPKPTKPATPTKKIARLRFAHASLQFSDPAKQREADIRTIFERGYDVITGTEAGAEPGEGGRSTSAMLRKQAADSGYLIGVTDRFDTWTAVKSSIVDKDFKAGARFALWRSSKTPGAKGRWGDKGVVWVGWDMGPTFGEFAVGSVHPLTKRGAGSARRKRASDIEYAKVVGSWINSLPDETSTFIGGDFNRVDKKYDLTMGQWPGASCWDDLRVHPNTGHGNIDAILRDKRDSRVKCISAKVLADKDLFLHTDHFLVEAVYEVTSR